MRKMMVLLVMACVLGIPGLSFSAVRIGVAIPIGAGPGYEVPAAPSVQVLQGTVVNSPPGRIVLQLPNGAMQVVYLTNQTQMNAPLTYGSPVSINAYAANGAWYAQVVTPLYAQAAPTYAYPDYSSYNDYPYYGYGYGYPYGYANFGFGYGRGFHREGSHFAGSRGSGFHGGGGGFHGGHGGGGHHR